MCRVIDLYNPKKLEINSDKAALDMLIPMLNLNGIEIAGNVYHNTLMYYSIKKCFDLIDEDYDIVIRARFDLLLQPKFSIENILNDLQNKKYDIYIPNEEFNMGGYNDQLAILFLI
jgi:hypothetical protein